MRLIYIIFSPFIKSQKSFTKKATIYCLLYSKCDKSQGLMECLLKCKEIIVKGRLGGGLSLTKKILSKKENRS